jgi:hypothetical protein
MNAKFRRYLIDGKVLFNRFRRLGLFLHLFTFWFDEHTSESLSQSTAVRQAIDIPEGDLHRLFAGFLPGSSQAYRYLSGS